MSSGCVAEVRRQAGDQALDAAVAVVAVALRLAQLGRHVLDPVELGVQRVDALEAQLAAVAELQRLVHLAPLQQGLEDAQRRRPGADADAGAGLGQRLGDRKAEAAVVRHAGDERALAAQVDVDHGGGYYSLGRPPKRRSSSPCGRHSGAVAQRLGDLRTGRDPLELRRLLLISVPAQRHRLQVRVQTLPAVHKVHGDSRRQLGGRLGPLVVLGDGRLQGVTVVILARSASCCRRAPPRSAANRCSSW